MPKFKHLFLVLFVLIFTFCLSLVAQAAWYYDAEELVLNTGVASNIGIVREPGAVIDYVSANVSFVAIDTIDQDVIERLVVPNAIEENDAYFFRWNNPKTDSLGFKVFTKIKMKNSLVKVQDKIDFPIKSLSNDVKYYLQLTDKIDVNQNITNLASNLAAGKSDLYEVVFELAKWTKNNVKYDLSTLTAEVSQPASWVLNSRVGVCDELTNLFIAMCRSLGIPARFVSGIAYTESDEFPEAWGAHGWAEVYFPNYGWIPFDPTYSEFGYVDPTHVILQQSLDSDKASTYYEWKGNGFKLNTEKLKVTTELVSATGNVPEYLSLKANILYDEIGFGSYNVFEAVLENNNPFYVTTELGLSKPAEVSVLSDVYQQVLLKPFEKKTVAWVLKLDDDLEKGFVYTFPIAVFTTRNSTVEVSFDSENDFTVYNYEDVMSYVEQKTDESKKPQSSNVDFACAFEKTNYFLNENAKVVCKISNLGNEIVNNLNVCVESSCKSFNLGLKQTFDANLDVTLDKPGEIKYVATLTGDFVSRVSDFKVTVLDKPLITIEDLSFPSSVEFNDNFTVSAVFKKSSISKPVNSKVYFELNGLRNSWDIDDFSNDRKFDIDIQANSLVSGNNLLKIGIIYQDTLSREFEMSKDVTIKLVNLTFGQKFLAFFNKVKNYFA